MINKQNLNIALSLLKLKINHFDIRLYEIEKTINQLIASRSRNKSPLLSCKRSTKYDILNRVKKGCTLLLGEGNLSFTISLLKKLLHLPNIITSTYESYSQLSEYTKFNAKLLKKRGVKVFHGLDATLLHKNFFSDSLDTIIFQFPHSGTRESIDGESANYVLIKRFIRSAFMVLKNNGVLLITIVDSDYYNNMFRFEELSEELRIKPPLKYKFDPADYPEYQHKKTNEDESGIVDYSKFATFEFRK